MIGTSLALRLREIVRGEVHANEPMWRHTSFRIGGPADVLVVPEDTEDLAVLLQALADVQVPFYVIGAGTNLLVADEGVRGVVIKLAGTLDDVAREDGNVVRSGAGVHLPALCRKAAAWGLAGLEFAGGIPGTVGGAVAMNAAAYGRSTCQVVRTVTALTYEGKRMRLDRDDLGVGVKTTRVLLEPLILVEAEFILSEDEPQAVLGRMQEYLEERSRKQPLSVPSAGCVFKNPTGGGAGRFIEAAGLKGTRVGGAEVSTVHANFIVNTGGATARDVLSLMEMVREAVYDEFGVVLEPEIRVLGG
ncbi:MAG: UDP-N-acetylmuramate dehydrogenase [Clostridia bacterium]